MAVSYYQSDDGLRLFYREFRDPTANDLPVVCLHGLTRNSSDFEDVDDWLGPGYRLIAPDIRGRGRSQRDPDYSHYHPGVYSADVWRLLDHLSVDRCVIIGTSMGGMIGMRMALQQPHRLLGLVLNDIGPEIGPAGIARIMEFVGRTTSMADWDEVAVDLRTRFGSAFPDLDHARWLTLVRRAYRENEDGRIEPNYDPNIGKALRQGPEEPLNLWSVFDEIAIPMLVLRGQLSDLLLPETLTEMQRRKPDLEAVTIANRGHVPQLNEDDSVAAIEGFLRRVKV